MTIYEKYDSSIPEYSKTMYLDGYTPYQILHAAHRQMREALTDDGDDMTAASKSS